MKHLTIDPGGEVAGVLEECRKIGVELWAEGESLRFRGQKSALSPCLVESIRRHKLEILARISQPVASFTPPPRALPPPQFVALSHAEVPAWVDDPSLSVSLAEIRSSIALARDQAAQSQRKGKQP